MLEIEDRYWLVAEDYFKNNQTAKKYIPEAGKPFYFIKTNKNEIYAVPRKRERKAHPAKHILGRGSYSLVVRVQNRQRQEFACRIFNKDFIIEDDYSVAVMEKLGVLLGQLERPKKRQKTVLVEKNIILYKNKGYQIQPLAPGITLETLVIDIQDGLRPRLSNLQIDLIFLKLCLALHEYHVKGIIHGDVNAANILVCLENGIIVTLVDQGFSILLKDGETSKTLAAQRGTLDFVAPEILDKSNSQRKPGVYSFQSDLYAIGVLFNHLSRQNWANKLLVEEPSERASLYEIMLEIIEKIRKENAKLAAPAMVDIENAKKIVSSYFYKRGTRLGFLIKHQLIESDITLHEFNLLAVYLCKAYFDAYKKDANVRIFSEQNFIVQRNNGCLQVTFQPQNYHFNDAFIAPERKIGVLDNNKGGVYALGKILSLLEIPVHQDYFADYKTRPDLVHLLRALCNYALKEPEEQCPNPFKRELEDLFNSFHQEQSLTYVSSNKESNLLPLEKLKSASSDPKERSDVEDEGIEEEVEQLIFQLDLNPNEGISAVVHPSNTEKPFTVQFKSCNPPKFNPIPSSSPTIDPPRLK